MNDIIENNFIELSNIVNSNYKRENNKMICDICNKELDPLEAHIRKVDGKLKAGHVKCWQSVD